MIADRSDCVGFAFVNLLQPAKSNWHLKQKLSNLYAFA